MELSFIPSPDVTLVLNTLLDILERRHSPSFALNEVEETEHPTHIPRRSRSIKVTFAALPLSHYFSQTDPEPRLVANEQLSLLEKNGFVQLIWLPNETNHILQAVTLAEQASHNTLYTILHRTPLANQRAHLEQLLLAEKFRFQGDWRARAINYVLNQLKAKKSPAPFNLIDSNLTLDLLTALQNLPALAAETPYRVFSVRTFNDSKRLEAIKSQLVSLARLGNPEWKHLPAAEVLRELNLVANPNYIHFSGNWQFTTEDGEVLNLSGFIPSVGFPAAQTAALQSVRAESVLCIENLTTFHQYIRTKQAGKYTEEQRGKRLLTRHHAILCTYGNPSPAIRHILRLIPETTPIYLWSDLDYGGFNILAQLRKQVGLRVQPYLMDIATFDRHAHLSRPLTQSDVRNLKRLARNPDLVDIHPILEHLLKRGLKLEQEAIQI